MEKVQASYAAELARAGLALRAFKLSPAKPFLWASGFYMPVYNDNRMFLFYPPYRKLITDAFEVMITSNHADFDVIAGTSTAGIPFGTMVAERLGAPFVYVRSKPKGHGLGNQIEGIGGPDALSGKKVILIEDLISTGRSSIEALSALTAAEGRVLACLSIFNYGMEQATRNFNDLEPPCRVDSILFFHELVLIASQDNYISAGDLQALAPWRSDPFNWGALHGFPPVVKGENR